jgi:hypothetical protein
VIELLKAFVDIALWRKGPQHLPTSVTLMLVAAGLDGVLTLIFARAIDPSEKDLALRTLLEVTLSLGWLWVLLALFRHSERFVQTATAVFGTSVLLTPLLFGMQAMLHNLEKGHMLQTPMQLGLITLFVWYLLVNAHILRTALEVNLFLAIVLTLLGTGCVYAIANRLLALTTQAA